MRHQAVPDEQHEDGADRRSEQSRALVRPVPADRLTDEGGDEGAGDAEQGRQNEPGRIVRAGEIIRAMIPATRPMMMIQTMLTCASMADCKK
jgi:hypothetical protein